MTFVPTILDEVERIDGLNVPADVAEALGAEPGDTSRGYRWAAGRVYALASTPGSEVYVTPRVKA